MNAENEDDFLHRLATNVKTQICGNLRGVPLEYSIPNDQYPFIN